MSKVAKPDKRDPFIIANVEIQPGSQATVDIPLSKLADHTQAHMKVHVIHGKKQGPTLFVSAAIHGDEIIGVEIVRRLVGLKALSRLKGTLILIPVVNTYGFVGLSRYLPDRRDLNRCFPGREHGSMAAQLAHAFMNEIVARSQYGIDLHSGAIHRANLPQIRADFDSPGVQEMATAFGAPIMLHSSLRDGSLRQAAQDVGCITLLYEASEALRFDEMSARIGVKGVLGVMRHIGMITTKAKSRKDYQPTISHNSHWLRSPMGGIMRTRKELGDSVKKGEEIAYISDPLGHIENAVTARSSGIIIGRSNLPIVNRGDALFHVAEVKNLSDATSAMDQVEAEADGDPLYDDPTYLD